MKKRVKIKQLRLNNEAILKVFLKKLKKHHKLYNLKKNYSTWRRHETKNNISYKVRNKVGGFAFELCDKPEFKYLLTRYNDGRIFLYVDPIDGWDFTRYDTGLIVSEIKDYEDIERIIVEAEKKLFSQKDKYFEETPRAQLKDIIEGVNEDNFDERIKELRSILEDTTFNVFSSFIAPVFDKYYPQSKYMIYVELGKQSKETTDSLMQVLQDKFYFSLPQVLHNVDFSDIQIYGTSKNKRKSGVPKKIKRAKILTIK